MYAGSPGSNMGMGDSDGVDGKWYWKSEHFGSGGVGSVEV